MSAARLRAIAAATLAFVLAFAFVRWWDFTIPAVGAQTYHAVFLANGQTFFGRYYDRIGPYVKVVDAYYIHQAADPEDPSRPGEARIVRRGGELHQPHAVMLIPKTSVLFVEGLSDTSPIAQFMARDR